MKKRHSNLDISLVFVLTVLMSSSTTLNLNSKKYRVFSVDNSIGSWKNFYVVRHDHLIEPPIIDILKFTIESIIDIYEAVEAEKNQVEIINHFSSIDKQLSDIEQEIQNIIILLKQMDVNNCYRKYEQKINEIQLIFKRYLDDSTEKNLQDFKKKAKFLYVNIELLMNGLLGKNTSKFCSVGDIFAAVRDVTGCGMRLKTKINAVMGLVMTGVWLYAEYEKMSNTSSLSFKESIRNSSSLLLERIETEMLNCRPDESNVDNEMRGIMKNYSEDGRKKVADMMFQFLEDKYETKKWIVIVLPEAGSQHSVYSAISGGFHSVSEYGMVAIAISVDRTLTLDWLPLKEFRLPIETVNNIYQSPPSIGFSLKPKRAARDVHEYLSLYLKPLRNQFIIESLVIQTPCQSSEEKMKKIVTVVTSNGTENSQIINNNGGCIGHFILIVPVNSSHSNSSLIAEPLVHQDCNYQVDYNASETELLRNEFGQAYLSVQGDSSQEDASIILESEWKNSTGQRWRFVDNQLKNDFGKCLTAYKEQSWYLYQYDCHSDWAGQIWYRHGFQIVNGFNMCLSYEGSTSGLMYVVQDLCDSTPPFLWYNWDTACEDAIVIPSSSVEGRPLRNEFSREYLSVYEDEVYVFHKPWNNQPGQKWKFVDGQLRNDRKKCLAGKGWYVRQVDCDDASIPLTAKSWTLNKKRQIVSDDGNCLSVGHKNGYVLNNNCKDEPEYRWWY